MKLIDITGKTFGRLTVLHKGSTRKSASGGSNWVCLCSCGNTITATGSNLRRGGTKSCGCLSIEWAKHLGSNKEFVDKRASSITKHGHKRKSGMSPEYATWLGMKRRCYDKKHKDYKNWGGKGIKLCKEWEFDFSQFLADMGEKPTQKHTIDRLDPAKDYSKQNCRWATQQQQGAENRSGILQITVLGMTFDSIANACRHFGVKATTVNERIKSGVPIDTAFTPKRLPSRRTKESYIRKDRR